jgi:glutathione S-transferase
LSIAHPHLIAIVPFHDSAAAAIGVVWIAGRAIYARDYAEAANKRGRGFTIQAVAAAVLWLLALVGVVKALLQAM